MKESILRFLGVSAAVLLVAGVLSAQPAPKPDDPVKWSQPVDLELGYDIPSYWRLGALRPATVVADDWRCPDGRPVTDVHWWGSFLEGNPEGLLGFEISIHADIVPDGIHPSHPGQLLQSSLIPVGLVTQQVFAENDDLVYQYNVDLPVPFEQELGTIYWLDIIAIVDNATKWGWHTGVRPQPDPTLDDAVMILDYNGQTGQYLTYVELFDAQGSVAMGYELTTGFGIPEPATMTLVGSALAGLLLVRRRSRKFAALLLAAVALTFAASGSLSASVLPVDGAPGQIAKWLQAPDLVTGRDIYSFQRPGDDSPPFAVADDWRCPDGLPISDIHWWGSYPAGKPATAPGVLGFEVSIHADIPSVDGAPSRPGTLLWSKQYLLGQQIAETFYGVDNNAEDVYQYDLLLPREDWFQQEQGTIYWLDIIAHTTTPDTVWGWHTAVRPAPDNGLDAAVMMFDYDPASGTYTRWGPLYDFCRVPMAFELTTVPEPGTLALVATMALGGMAALRRRRTK